MNKRLTFLCLSILMLCIGFPMYVMGVIINRPVPDAFYSIKIDTSSVFVGYLGVDPVSKTRIVASNEQNSETVLWKFVEKPINDYYIINKATKDTLSFNVTSQTDTVASLVKGGALNTWVDLFNVSSTDEYFFKSPANKGNDSYTLTFSDGVVYLSNEKFTTLHRLGLSIVRYKVFPDADTFYKLKVNTTASFDANSPFLRADTVKTTRDSLAVDSLCGNLSMWKFIVDTLINDTAYFKILNKETNNLLAFDVPSQDTIAVVKNSGSLNIWRLPFYSEDNCVARFVVCDTAAKKDYYLGMTSDSVVMLLTDTTTTKSMLFSYSDNVAPPVVVPPVKSRFDSTQVYKVKYLTGVNSGKYMAKFFNMNTVVDSVYAHIPDGQYVVNRLNTNSLINRTVSAVYTDTMKYVVVDTSTVAGVQKLDTIENLYVYKGDTVEVLPITYGDINTLKTVPSLGYDYFAASDLASLCYTFKYAVSDTLQDRLLGYNRDSLMTILAAGDSAKFIIEEKSAAVYGVRAIGGIAGLERHSYVLRSIEDTTLYVSVQKGAMDIEANKCEFYLKEGENKNEYYFVSKSGYAKLLVDSTNKVVYASIDTAATSLFSVSSQNRPSKVVEESDPYRYLKALPNGRGMYNIIDINTEMMLTCNYYNDAVFRREGQSIMLRAGSYTPSDFSLWIDTARGTGFNADKPSFYIIRDADFYDQNPLNTAEKDTFKVSGSFLHVMDSMSLSSHSDYVVTVGGVEYNMVNFVKGKRYSANELLLESQKPSSKDSVGFAGKNEDAIAEYRFYLQQTDSDPNKYYIVTEANYGGKKGVRGYLSLFFNGKLYVGPRGDSAVRPITLVTSNPVANEAVRPYVVPEVAEKQLAIVGGSGQISVLNAMGKRAMVYNVVGQQVADKMLDTDNEIISAPRGIAIVKVGNKTQKVVVK